jgi:hypothetical protein
MRREGALAFSALVHVLALGAASLTWLVNVERVSEPPVVIHFVSALPPAPRPEPIVADEPEAPALTKPEPVRPEASHPNVPPLNVAPSPPPERPTEPSPPSDAGEVALPPAHADAMASAAAAPGVVPAAGLTVVDNFEPTLSPLGAPPRGVASEGGLSTGRVAAFAPGVRGGTDVPGSALSPAGSDPGRHAGPTSAGGVFGQAPPRPPDPVRALPGTPRKGASGGRRAASGVPGADTVEPDAGAGDEEAAIQLGRRYSVRLVDARRLGHSTHDGWRYNQIVPALSEAYRRIARLGEAISALAGDADVVSVRVDPDAVVITYRDGTRHVIAPTRDGLVALYVAIGPAERSKVEEAQRALGALNRLLREEVRS